MAIDESNLAKRISEGPINYALMKLINHELGNAQAVLSGYRHLLQRAISAQAQEAFPPAQDIWRHQNEQYSGYLRIMQERETLLQDFLAQLRALAAGVTSDRFCQHFVRADLVVLLRRVIEQLVPLYPDHFLQATMPVQSLFIMCGPFWMELALEHVINHTAAAQTGPAPVEIHLEPSPNHMGQEAKITLRSRRALPELTPGREGMFEAWSRVLGQGDLEVCLALCREVLQEHGGRIWSEQEGEQEGTISLALPLVE